MLARYAGALAAGAMLIWPTLAASYEFEVRTRTVGQGHQLRSLRISSGDLELDRRRYTQIVTLNLWDLMSTEEEDSGEGPDVYFTSYLRMDHDFGDFTTGQLVLQTEVYDAIDIIPELAESSLALDVLFAYAAAEGLAGGHIDLRLGRQLSVETLDWFAFDGLWARVETPLPVALESWGGLRVRDSSPLAGARFETTGTSEAACEEYVEGAVPGSGAWRPIDRAMMGEQNMFFSDLERCPQRMEMMPTFGFAVAADGVDALDARLAYRRSVSRTPGQIGEVDRFEFPDAGLYPNELGEAPGWGVNEELIAATARVPLARADRVAQVEPFLGVRYSLLHGLIDEARLGTALRRHEHALTPEFYYSFPTFDGDSIFNVFSIEPYSDLRLTYDFFPEQAKWSAYARSWGRAYGTEDAAMSDPASPAPASRFAGGVQAGVRHRRYRLHASRLDAYYEDGYGGRRVGGFLSAERRVRYDVSIAGRLSLAHLDDPFRSDLRGPSAGAQAGMTYEFVPGVAFSLMAEENTSPFHKSQFGLWGILDMAFVPEM